MRIQKVKMTNFSKIYILILFVTIIIWFAINIEVFLKDLPPDAIVTTTNIIKNLITKYKVDRSYTLKEDPWIVAKHWLTGRYVHPQDTPQLGAVLQALATKKIISADVFNYGAQLKMLFYLKGGQKAVFRPKMYEREFIVNGIRKGNDRHNGEIAAYHIGRILEFRRAPIVTGRFVDVDSEIMLVATEDLKKSFVTDQKGNKCFTQPCAKCSNKGNLTACADVTLLEGSITLWLSTDMKEMSNPWERKRYGMQRWETDDSFCTRKIRENAFYADGPLLMDIIDTAILDFLIGNADRHTQYLVREQTDSMIVMLDNAKSFGNPYHNEELMYLLAPLYQCCQLRESTWTRMLYLQGILGDVLKGVLDQDPIAPVLTQDHLDGLNRRLNTAINTARNCINTYGNSTVISIDSL